MIYFFNEEGTNRVKIGTTKNPIENRIKHLQTGNSIKLVLIYDIDGDRINEKHIHKALCKYRVNGGGKEWVEFPDKEKMNEFFNKIERIGIRETLKEEGYPYYNDKIKAQRVILENEKELFAEICSRF
jgi:hypothetical protein